MRQDSRFLAFGARSWLTVTASLLAPAMLYAQSPLDERGPTTIALDLSSALQPTEASQPAASSPAPPANRDPSLDKPEPEKDHRFGLAGSEWITIGLGYTNNFQDDQAGDVHASYSRFLSDEIEFALELGVWYFDQTGDNAAGLSPTLNFRWHFLHDERFDWTVYGDVGIGVLFATDNVPDGGTGFDFTPRAGVGFTKALDKDGNHLQVGVRWQHISNGRIEGDERNPGRDSLMIYAGIIFPF